MKQKIYHIYAKGECIYHSLTEEEFKKTWKDLNRLSEFLSDSSRLSYEELEVNTDISLQSSY